MARLQERRKEQVRGIEMGKKSVWKNKAGSNKLGIEENKNNIDEKKKNQIKSNNESEI